VDGQFDLVTAGHPIGLVPDKGPCQTSDFLGRVGRRLNVSRARISVLLTSAVRSRLLRARIASTCGTIARGREKCCDKQEWERAHHQIGNFGVDQVELTGGRQQSTGPRDERYTFASLRCSGLWLQHYRNRHAWQFSQTFAGGGTTMDIGFMLSETSNTVDKLMSTLLVQSFVFLSDEYAIFGYAHP
jgi:hypothetical protein